MDGKVFRVLSLDGGGAKGFYSLGVLDHIESMVGGPLVNRFDLIFGTSTGSIIAALLGLGCSVEQIHTLYKTHVPRVMKKLLPSSKSRALAELSKEVFGNRTFEEFTKPMGIVSTNWDNDRPTIFKSYQSQARRGKASFVPGFGCTIGDAVQASCSAYPFFSKKVVTTSGGDRLVLIDGGFCANNPTLYAIADCVATLGIPLANVRLISVGVGVYPSPPRYPWHLGWWLSFLPWITLAQKVLEINTQSMDELRAYLYGDISTVRISQPYSTPDMATDMFEHDMTKLNQLRQRGKKSAHDQEDQLRAFLF